jgi:hypothetical protein
VAENYLRLEVFLPWLLAMLAETLQPLIPNEGTLLLEKKYRQSPASIDRTFDGDLPATSYRGL